MAAVEAATEKIVVTLPDGKPLELPAGATGADAAAAIGPGLAKAALAIRVDGELRDLSAPLPEAGAEIGILTDRDPEALELIRHDAAHVMAEAVIDLYPGDEGDDRAADRVRLLLRLRVPGRYEDQRGRPGEDRGGDAASTSTPTSEFGRRDVPVAEAMEIFRAQDQGFKVELIEDLVENEGVETVSLYKNGPFEDLCRGPHGPSTGRIKAIKLSSVAGAYWRGDEHREQLTRIYGTAFFSKKDLEQHLERIEEAKARDHRRLGPQLGLFMLRDEAPGMPFWLPNGTTLLHLIEAEVQEQLRKRGYQEIATPQVLDEELWHRSGHWDNYRDEMYFMEDGERRFALRPMNCPGACLVYSADRHSYRELPLRLAEFGRVSRNEREGVLHGLLRVRAFTQDDAHVYCTEEQITDEVASICEAIDELYARFGFEDVKVELSTRPEKSMGSEEQWAKAEAALTEALDRQGREYELNPGDGAFYGPKIDFHVTDALGRSWQCGTCQLDFQMPERFDLTYTGADDDAAPAGDDPPRPARLDGALRRDPDRALRRPLPGLAGAGAGDRPADLRPPQRVRRRGRSSELREARRAGRDRRPLGVGRQEDPRRRDRPLPLHAGGRRSRAGGRRGRRPLARRRGAGGDVGGRVRRPGQGRDRRSLSAAACHRAAASILRPT